MNRWNVAIIFLSCLCSVTAFTTLYYLGNAVAEWYVILLVIIGIVIEYLVLIKIAKTKNGLIPSQISALVLIFLAIPIFGYAIIGVSIPQTQWFRSLDVAMACPDGTNVFFHLDLNFSTSGVFSAENPIHVNALIYNLNITDDLTKHLGAISFTNAFNINEKNVVGGVLAYGFLPIYNDGNGQYSVDGKLIWHQSEKCYIIPLPPFQGNLTAKNYDSVQLYGDPVLYVSSTADTLAFRTNHVILQLTYVVIGFSVIMLHPILKELFPDSKLHKKKK